MKTAPLSGVGCAWLIILACAAVFGEMAVAAGDQRGEARAEHLLRGWRYRGAVCCQCLWEHARDGEVSSNSVFSFSPT
jgi:hypothetical protein